jgi:hypothetical protein
LAEAFRRMRLEPDVERRLVTLQRSLFRTHFPPHSPPLP